MFQRKEENFFLFFLVCLLLLHFLLPFFLHFALQTSANLHLQLICLFISFVFLFCFFLHRLFISLLFYLIVLSWDKKAKTKSNRSTSFNRSAFQWCVGVCKRICRVNCRCRCRCRCHCHYRVTLTECSVVFFFCKFIQRVVCSWLWTLNNFPIVLHHVSTV